MDAFLKTSYIRFQERLLKNYLRESAIFKMSRRSTALNGISIVCVSGLYTGFIGIRSLWQCTVLAIVIVPFLVQVFLHHKMTPQQRIYIYRGVWCLAAGGISLFSGGIFSPFIIPLFALSIVGSLRSRTYLMGEDLLTGLGFPFSVLLGLFIFHLQGVSFPSAFTPHETDILFLIVTVVSMVRLYFASASHARIVLEKENEAQEFEKQINLVIENANAFMITIDPVRQRILKISNSDHSSEHLFWKSLENLHFLNITHEAEARQQLLLAFSQAMRKGNSHPITIPMKTSSGDMIWFDAVATALRDNRHEHTLVREVVLVCHDITFRLQNEGELRRARDAFEAANKAKLIFLSNMSHELKTPLNAIIGFSDLIRSQIMGPIGHPKYQEYIEAIYDSGSHLLELIVDILDISRIEAGRYDLSLGNYSPAHLMEECFKLVELTAVGKDTSLKIQSHFPENIDVHGDRRATKQVILNLLNNAIKYCPPRSKIILQGGIDPHNPKRFLIGVKDNGPGMPPKIIEGMGTPFINWTAADVRQEAGTGLGLSIVKSLTDLQDGRIKILLPPEGGTEVWLSFPVLYEGAQGPSTCQDSMAQLSLSETHTGKGNVFLNTGT